MPEQGTTEWHMDRLGKVTASRVSDVMMKPTTAGYQNYMAQLVCERLTGNPTEMHVTAAMQHGTDTEPQARAMYEIETGNEVEETGFVPHPTLAMAGASPDGLVGDAGLLEIKCPQPATHIRTLTGADIDRKYLLQMHWQMECTRREWCDFVSFCPSLPPEMQMHLRRIEVDAELIEEMREAVTTFLAAVDAKVAELQKLYGRAEAA